MVHGMETMPVGELKRRFSEVIEAIKNGERIIVSYGKKKTKIAVIVPFSQYAKENGVKLGLLILICFQDETNCAIFWSWQDHERQIRTWWQRLSWS